jgi:hypothetical protein
MTYPTSTYVRRLRHFKDVIRERGPTPIRRESQSDAVTNLQYYIMAIPKDVDDEEKNERLGDLAEVVTTVPDSDVFVIAMWIGE